MAVPESIRALKHSLHELLSWDNLLVLLSPVNYEAVLMSVSQSSNCEESFSFNMGISCNNEFSRDNFF